jgi:hypothetical protein
MRTFHSILFLAFLFSIQPLFAQLPNNMEGDWSGAWNNNNPVNLRGNIRYVLIQSGTTGNRDFLFNDGPGDYMPEFKLKTFLTNPQTLNARIIDPLTNAGNNIQFPATTGNWYMMIVEATTDNNDLSILELGNQPENIDTVLRCPIFPNSSASVALSVPTSFMLSAGEQLWVHYSIDSFATSNFLQLTGSPPAANIPAFPHDTTVQYYFLTTNSSITLNANDVEYQAFDIFYQGSYGHFFSYTVDDSNGTIGAPCFVFPTAEICGDGEDNDGDGLTDGFDLDCGLCTGTLGENAIPGGDFGTISADGQHPTQQPDPAANPGVTLGNELPPGVTTFTYGFSSNFACVNGSLCFPDDGNYVIANSTNGMLNSPSNPEGWIEIEHNGPEPDGYFMVVNASPNPGIFFQFDLSTLCPNTVYEFSTDVINLIPPSRSGLVFPNIDFILADTGSTLAALQNEPAAANTGDVPQDSAWHTYGFTFVPTTNTLTFALRNNNPGGVTNVGNDLAIDNISFRPCGPTVSVINPGVFCAGNTVSLDASVTSGYNNPQYQWQYSSSGSPPWTDISGATNEDYNFTSMANSDSGFYRLLVAESGNIQDSLCRIVSDPVYLQLQCPLEARQEETEGDFSREKAFRIFPNPTTGQSEIRFSATEKQLVQASLWNMVGQKVWEINMLITEPGEQQIEVNWSELPAGVYGLRLGLREEELYRKLIIK